MNDLETRLRSELPELAEALLEQPPAEGGAGVDPVADDMALRSVVGHRRSVVATVAASIVLAVTVGAMVVIRGSASTETLAAEERLDTATAIQVISDFGEWSELGDAPIEARAFPITAWLDGELVVWAGSGVERGFAFTDGAAYDPASERWRVLEVPGWGHPGLTGVVVDGDVAVTAKGAVTMLDFATGAWSELPGVDGLLVLALVEHEEELYAVGRRTRVDDVALLSIARWDGDRRRWEVGAGLEDPLDLLGAGRSPIEVHAPVLSTAEGIVIWSSDGAVRYQPDADAWYRLAPLRLDDRTVSTSTAVVTEVGVVAVARTEDEQGRVEHRLATWTGSDWTWSAARLPTVDLDQVTLMPANEWLVMVERDLPPVVLHVPTGAWDVHLDGPLVGLVGPGSAWTGEQLLIWGGAPGDGEARSVGAVWTPPDPDTAAQQECRPAAELEPPAGLHGQPVDELLPLGLRPGVEVVDLVATRVDDATFDGAWYAVTGIVRRGDAELGRATWGMPDAIAASVSATASVDPLDTDEWHLYATDALAEEMSSWRRLDGRSSELIAAAGSRC